MIHVALAGASGRMGRQVLEQLLSATDFRLVGALESSRNPELGTDAGALIGRPTGVRLTDDVRRAIEKAHVVVDFSSPDATASVLRAAAEKGIACVVGTTGLTDEAKEALDEASTKVAVVAAPNMSVGVQTLGEILREAMRLLGPDFDVEILETHHRAKIDAPSGTALRLLEIATQAQGEASSSVRNGRKGNARRERGEIGVHAIRGGDVVGDHTVILAGDGERIEITHRATSRAVFASGALRAAQWAVGQPPGKYTMAQVLGLR
ncbi:MAG: 4-hydroxy-tetrahydrodipicolinate reductase [Deltaproteobacteria bacterium]|nr:4-hydroxy-tetrahydrodipicolinate reductase [Deltaproteobacteria bacterium]